MYDAGRVHARLRRRRRHSREVRGQRAQRHLALTVVPTVDVPRQRRQRTWHGQRVARRRPPDRRARSAWAEASVTGPPWGRPAAAVASGLAVTAASAVVLGDYPLSGAVPWITPILVPLLIGAAMTLIDRLHAPGLWMLTGPLAALGVLWGRASPPDGVSTRGRRHGGRSQLSHCCGPRPGVGPSAIGPAYPRALNRTPPAPLKAARVCSEIGSCWPGEMLVCHFTDRQS